MADLRTERFRTAGGITDLAVTGMAVAAMLRYPIAFAVLYPALGSQTFPFAIVPVGLTAWRVGAGGGIGAVAIQLATSTFILNAVGIHGWAGPLAEGQAPVSLVLVATALSIGFLRELRTDLTQRAREAEALADATRVLVERTASHETLQGILAAAMGVVPSSVAAFVVPIDGGRAMRVAALTNGDQAFLGRTYSVAEGISGRAFRTGAVQRVDHVEIDPDYVAWTPDMHSALAIPIVRGGVPRGIVYLEDRAGARFSDRDVRIMRAFADHASIALEAVEREHALGAATDRFAAAFEAVPSAMLITSMPDSRIVEANAEFLRLTGFSRSEVVGKTTSELGILHPEDRERVLEQLKRTGFANDVVMRAAGGETRILDVSADIVAIGGVSHLVSGATANDSTHRAAQWPACGSRLWQPAA